MSRFIKAFPGAGGACCEDMVRANVCDPCCTDAGCPDPPASIAVQGYTDGIFGSSDACEAAGCAPKEDFSCRSPWNGVLDFFPAFDTPCRWQILQTPCPGEPGLSAAETYDGVVLDVGSYVDRTVDLESCQAFYTFVLFCAQTPSGNCILFSDVKVATIGSAEDTPLGTYEGGTVFV